MARRITKSEVAHQIVELQSNREDYLEASAEAPELIANEVDKLVSGNTMLVLQQMLKDLQEPASSEPTEVWFGASKMLYDASIKFALTEDGKPDYRQPQYDDNQDYLMTFQLTFFGGETATAKFQKIKGSDWTVNFMSGRLNWMWKNIKQGSGKTPDVASALKWIQNRGIDGEIVAVEQQNQKSQENPHDAH